MCQPILWFCLCFLQQSDATLSTQLAATSELASKSTDKDTAETVLLQFRDQEWRTALEWLAQKLELNLDWQTLPEDKLSLSSTQELSLSEVEDLFNMQLLARGFTLLKRDGVLRLVQLKGLDITLVPRVDPSVLEELPKHSIARVSFPLQWMIADEAATELKPLLSPYGSLSPMSSSNRLEVVDAVVNLREFHKLLIDAEEDDARKERVAEFRLKYRKAEDLAPKVRQLLGLPMEDRTSASSMSQLDIEQARFKVEAVKQMGRDARDLLSEKKPTMFLVVNEKENSLLVNAPPNKIEIVRQAVDAMDKPIASPDSAWETISRVKVYEVDGFDPDALRKMIISLQDNETLSKDVRLQYETAYNRFIVFASPSDQLTIAQLIESFRSEKRGANVLPLANVDPVYAAKAVLTILKSPERTPAAAGIPSDGKFQIEADPDHNRVLLWATPAEVREVREFLARLGETFTESQAPSNIHVISMDGQDKEDVLKRLKQVWKDVSDVPLIVDPQPEQDENPTSESKKKPTEDTARLSGRDSKDGRFVTATLSKTKDGSQESSSDISVRLMEGGSGDLVILSKDPVASETAKRLLQQMLKNGSRLRVIDLKNTQASIVKKQIELLLQSRLSPSTSNKLAVPQPTVTIDIDTRTNRLLVQNASDVQWKAIQETANVLDQLDPNRERLERKRITYRVKNRKASIVAETLNATYQDLLTISDRTLANLPVRSTAFNRNLAATAANPEYQGLLSISVDKEANLIIVSAPSHLADEVVKLAESMDTPSDGAAIAIIPAHELPFGPSGPTSASPEALRKLFKTK